MRGWVAPRARTALRARVELPGSKSQTNRALVIAALADGPSRITRPLRARDTELMAAALRALGVRIDEDGRDWLVTPADDLHGGQIDVGLAGTVMRFVPPVAALGRGTTGFDGDPYARERPMATLLDGLRQVGVEIDDGGRGALPFTVRGTGAVAGGPVHVDASASSQYVSGLLLAGARYDKGIEITHTGAGPVPSQPHLEMTVAMLRGSGVDVDASLPGTWRVRPGAIHAREQVIEPDLSNAAPFLAAAMVTGGEITIPGWPAHTTQAGDALRDLLAAMGARVKTGEHGLTVRAGERLRGLDADLHDVGELTPTLAALAALADSPSRLSGIEHLRGHETDRITALATELRGLGCDAAEEPAALLIEPKPLHGGRWHAYADHRMATAGAVLGLAVDGVVVDDIDCTAKTLPGFAGMWAQLVDGQSEPR